VIFDEQAGPLDLQIQKHIRVKIIPYLLFVLYMETPGSGHVSIGMVGRIVEDINAGLQNGGILE